MANVEPKAIGEFAENKKRKHPKCIEGPREKRVHNGPGVATVVGVCDVQYER